MNEFCDTYKIFKMARLTLLHVCFFSHVLSPLLTYFKVGYIWKLSILQSQ